MLETGEEPTGELHRILRMLLLDGRLRVDPRLQDGTEGVGGSRDVGRIILTVGRRPTGSLPVSFYDPIKKHMKNTSWPSLHVTHLD